MISQLHTTRRLSTVSTAALLLFACGGSDAATGTMESANATGASLADGYRAAKWQSGVTVAFPSSCTMTFTSTGAPSHGQAAYYLVPGGTTVAVTPTGRLSLGVNTVPVSTRSTTYSMNICPAPAASTTATRLGATGWMISGAALFNPYEGDGSTVANADNVSYTFTDNSGVQRTASFIDTCGGHSTPVMAGSATYHYHGWSSCLTQAAGDVGTAASHIIGVALDGYPIYGDRDLNGAQVDVSRLDACNGITSPTPEFPNGVYHYVLPSGAASRTAQSAPRCYRGTVSSALLTQISANIGYCWGAPANLSAVAATGTARRRVGG